MISAAFLKAARSELPPNNIRDDLELREIYGHDESDTADFLPDAVIFAENTEQVQTTFRLSQQFAVPVTPVAARSGKSGGSLPIKGGVSLSLERMNKILSIQKENLIAVAQPGVITGDLMKAVEAEGLFYPPDPNSWEMCTLGGNVAENAGGPRALKYGVTRDYVLGLEWVLPNGEGLRCGRQTIKGVAGYDVVGLWVGSEGTLGIATEITLQLIPKPAHVLTSLVIFSDVQQAAGAVSAVLASGVLPRTLELLDDVAIRAVNGRGYNFPANAGACVICEVDGNHADGLLAELASAGEIFEKHGAIEVLIAQDEGQREKLWAARRQVSTALRSMQKFKISEDVCVPRSKIAEAIGKFKQLGTKNHLTVATYGHAGDGNLHANVLYNRPDERPKVDALLKEMMQITVNLGGTITGEHGVGIAKKEYLPMEQSGALIDFQRMLKKMIDPKNLCNPGKIFPD